MYNVRKVTEDIVWVGASDRPLHNRREKIVIKGELSSPINPENRCRFAGRCAYCTEGCKTKPAPKLVEVSPNHFVACHRSAELVDKLNKNN